ncbi:MULTISPECIES: cyclase family protein [unclassified Roseiflexus]|jgi:kynurenine formamidase|uniref:cyclase family protein n=1 Tax=unclassified Roseiflexus TaxID=2609473 RepID=UPI0000D815F5|nr:cyclase family protein [Roseiflexus sp.]ABQ89618.1 cyclase family protein [Roseiflexus sp. RS-1]MCL6541591.1 cyclase family protein [Roseiflexus sp.]
MCPPETLASMRSPEISRRNLLKFGLGAAVAAALPVGSAHAATVRRTTFRNVADLTHVLGTQFPLFPGAAPFRIQQAVSHDKDGYYGSILTYWEHSGTHMDAPVHFAPNGLFVDQLRIENLVVPAVVINITEKVRRDPDAVVTPDDIRAWERRYGRIPDNAAVLMASGWGARAGSVEAFRNTDSSGVMHFPGFGKEAIDFLLTERRISGIGVDTLSLDHGPSTTFAVHYTILPTNRWGLENLANLESIPPSGATLFVGAPKIASGSGGPTRVMAVW